MAFSSVLQMYISWTNSIMCERGVLIEGVNELQDGIIFCHLIELLTGTDLGVGQLNDCDKNHDCRKIVQVALDYLEDIGVKVKATAAGVVCGELKSILDTMWAIIRHCTIHTPDRPVNQRTIQNGRKALLQWCIEELPHTAFSLDTCTTMVKCFSHNNLLADLISVHCSFASEVNSENKMVAFLADAILAAEEQLGISKTLVGPSDVINGTVDEHALLTYVALLQRKVNVLMSRTSSLSSLSSNENITFQMPVNSSHEIVEALHKANSFKFIRRQCKGNSRKFVLRLRWSKLKKLQEHCAQTRRLSNTSNISLTSQMSSSLKAPHNRITEELESVEVNTSEQPSVRSAVSNQPGITPPIDSPQIAKQLPIRHLDAKQQVEMEIQPDRRIDPDQRSLEGQQVDSGGGGDNGVEIQQGVKDARISLRQLRPSENGDGVSKAEDELLGLLDAINLESANLRLELNESKERENTFKEELERSVTSTAEEHVVSKLVQELEMLRIENRRLFRDSANARNKNACDKRTTEKLQAIITKLQNDVDYLNAENFRLKLRNKLLESHQLHKSRGAYGQESEWDILREKELLQQAASDVFLMDQFLDLPDDEDWVPYLTSSQQLLSNFSEVNVQMATNLSELNDELTNLKVSNRHLQQENQFLKMASETSRLESGLTTNQCHSLEDNLSSAQNKNPKLVQDLHDVAMQPSLDADNMHTFLRIRQLKEDNAMLEQRLELADEDRAVLKKELQQYKKNQSVIDAMLKGESDTSFKEVIKVSKTKQDIAKNNVMQNLKCKDELEAAEAEQLQNDSVQEDLGCRMKKKEEDGSLDINYSRSITNGDQINVTVSHENNLYKQWTPNSNAIIKTHLRKSSLGDLIVAKSTNHPLRNAVEAEDSSCVSQSEMSEDDYDSVFDKNCVLSKPSVDEVTNDDMNSQITDESYVHNELGVKYIQEDFLLNSMPRRSQFSTLNSSMMHLRSITEKFKPEFSSSQNNKQTQGSPANEDNSLQDKDADAPQCFGERNNPRLARLQELRRSLGIAKEDNLSNHDPAELTPTELSEFELKSKLNRSDGGGITRWNTFNSIKAADVDLGNSYICGSSKQSSVPASQTRGIKKKMTTTEISTSKHSSALVSGRQCQRPGVGNMQLDNYVQALKDRVKSSETEADEMSDEYISLPEHFQEPRRLAERSPKQITAIISQDEPLEPSEIMVSNEKPAIKIETKTEYLIQKKNGERNDGTDRLMVRPRISGDGMSESQAKNDKVIAEEDVEVGEAGKNADSGKIQFQQIKFNTDTTPSRMQSPEYKRMSSPVRTELPGIQKKEEVDSLVHSILSEADKSVSSTDKLHLSSSEDSKSYKHHLLKDEEQEYANSIIEKYLGQLSVLPQ